MSFEYSHCHATKGKPTLVQKSDLRRVSGFSSGVVEYEVMSPIAAGKFHGFEHS